MSEKERNNTSGKNNAAGGTDSLNKIDLEEEVQRLLDSGEWKAMQHGATGKTYYYHAKTRQTCWDLKKELRKQRKSAAEAAETSSPTPKTAMPSTSLPTESNKEKKESFKHGNGNSVSATEKGHEEAAHSNGIGEGNNGEESAPVKGNLASDGGKTENDKNGINSNRELYTLSSFSEKEKAPVTSDTYKDPLERLMNETKRLEQLMASSGTSEAMALEFKRSYEALASTNTALSAQMVKMKREYDAMDMALRDANVKIYEKDLALREAQGHARVVNKEEESARTLAFLREQNHELVRQVGELTVTLSRGFNEMSYQQALSGRAGAASPEAMAADPPALSAPPPPPSLGATLDTFLANPFVRQSLCGRCGEALARLRLSLLPEAERATARGGERANAAVAKGAHRAQYTAAPAAPFDHCGHPTLPPTPPPLQQQQQQQQQQQKYAARDGAQEEYGGGRGHSVPQQWGSAQGYTEGYATQIPVPAGTYSERLTGGTADRHSVPRASSLGASPLFGGFRIRPAY